MPRKHVVEQGECIDSIAFAYGHFPETLWTDAANAALKELRPDPNVLLPGDEVTIPDKRLKTVMRATGATHRFRRKGVPEKLRLQFLREGEARANEAYVLEIDGVKQSGTTDAEGRLEQWIPPNARRGKVVFHDTDAYELLLGELDPIDTISGVQARLRSLGFYEGPIDGEETVQMEEAIQEFQAASQLDPFGAIDEATRAALRTAYGG
ncbi:MAG: peptidoglycan-binding domain-containing protein [Acidobacteriota bacterium]